MLGSDRWDLVMDNVQWVIIQWVILQWVILQWAILQWVILQRVMLQCIILQWLLIYSWPFSDHQDHVHEIDLQWFTHWGSWCKSQYVSINYLQYLHLLSILGHIHQLLYKLCHFSHNIDKAKYWLILYFW